MRDRDSKTKNRFYYPIIYYLGTVNPNAGKAPAAGERGNAQVSWIYTKFNYDQLPIIPDEACKYRIEGKELTPTNRTPHIQGFVIFKEKYRWTTLVNRYPGINWLPMSSKATPYQNFVYCSKDGDFTEFGPRPKAPKEKTGKGNDQTAFGDAFNATTVKEGMEILKRERPRDIAIHGEAIERNLKRAKIEPFQHKYPKESFAMAHQEFEDSRSILLYGDSGIGKTHFAASHFTNPLVCSHIDNLKQLSPDNDGVVFDDMSFKHWPVESVIHLLDREFTRSLNVRYGTVSIPSGVKKIFTHNTNNPFYNEELIEPEQKIAIERRLKKINILGPVYRRNIANPIVNDMDIL